MALRQNSPEILYREAMEMTVFRQSLFVRSEVPNSLEENIPEAFRLCNKEAL